MSIRQRVSGIWLMSMSLLALFAFTCYFVAQMWLSILRTAYLTLVILQIAALTVYLWGPEKLKHRWQKILYRLFYASSFFVIPAFLLSSVTEAITSLRPRGSSIAVGSSNTMHSGLIATAPAMAILCF